jgi:hypothetical protein
MVEKTNLHAIPLAAPGQLAALERSALPIAKALDLPRLLSSASPPPIPPPSTLSDHGIGIRVDSHR